MPTYRLANFVESDAELTISHLEQSVNHFIMNHRIFSRFVEIFYCNSMVLLSQRKPIILMNKQHELVFIVTTKLEPLLFYAYLSCTPNDQQYAFCRALFTFGF